MKKIIIAGGLFFCSNLVFAGPSKGIVEIDLVEEQPTCFQGPAQALEGGMISIMKNAREICHNEYNGFLQFTKVEDIDIDLSQSEPPCGSVSINIRFRCTGGQK